MRVEATHIYMGLFRRSLKFKRCCSGRCYAYAIYQNADAMPLYFLQTASNSMKFTVDHCGLDFLFVCRCLLFMRFVDIYYLIELQKIEVLN